MQTLLESLQEKSYRLFRQPELFPTANRVMLLNSYKLYYLLKITFYLSCPDTPRDLKNSVAVDTSDLE